MQQGAPTDADHSRARWLSARGAMLVGSGAVVLALLLGVLLVVREQAALLGLDEQWAERMVDIRGPLGVWLATAFDTIGGNLLGVFIIPAGITITLFAVRRPFAALYYLSATIASALLVQLLKNYFDRPRPEDMLVTSDHGSFPSGHVANAATMATTLAVIFPFVWVAVAGAAWTVLMAISRTYLGVHWITDTIGGVFVGVGIALILSVPFAARLEAERVRRRSSVVRL